MAITIQGARRVDIALRRFASGTDIAKLLDEIGAEVESQTVRRINNPQEKRSPDGEKWKKWSKGYAGSSHGSELERDHPPHPQARRESQGHRILELTGSLLGSITHEVRGDEVLIGTNLPYAGPVNAQREFLGLSRDDEDDVNDVVEDWIRRALR